ncbi:glycoside hydrolase family 3 protein [Paenibacillus mesophilus]|uniref:glycoside hydrolase family 3 protein n=1 Tax=Paenibacillus mesophilus TaxID=2582849 RepID=UPI0013051787|nr:glycoside hydrolase family 3 N-terminal domain-containing protein [Paenibacillus mesophilus]
MSELKDRIRRMTLREQVGQLFTFYNTGLVFSDFAKRMIADYKAGGMFLDMGSLDRPAQVHRLTSAMQQASMTEGSGIPLFISADFVAGAGCKLKSGGAVHFPKNKAVGAAGDEALAYESGRVTAEESLAMGVNFNYSPVVDINNNPLNPVIGTHSFGEDRDQVAAMGCAVIRGYQEHGMIATAKHFPGHGDTQVDSHFDLPVLPFDRTRLDSFELVPFRKSIEAGVDAVMVGHIAVPALDASGLPASLSYKMTTGLLREELGFGGLIVTDGLSMKGVTSKFTQAEACVLALQAGADILLAHARNVEEAGPMVEAVLTAVRRGELSEERIKQSVERILNMKAKYGLLPETFRLRDYDGEKLNKPESESVSIRLARKAALAVNGFKPLKRTEATERWTLVWDKQVERFAELVRLTGTLKGERRLEAYADVKPLLGEGTLAGPVIVALTHNKRMDADVLQALNQYAAEHPGDVVLVHFGSSYDLEHVPAVPALLLYDSAPSLQQSAAEALFGS